MNRVAGKTVQDLGQLGQVYLTPSNILISVSLGVSRCLSVSLGVSRCLSMSFGVSRCLSMSLDVSRCLSMSFDVSRCLSMSLDVSRCLSVSLGVSRCLSVPCSCSCSTGTNGAKDGRVPALSLFQQEDRDNTGVLTFVGVAALLAGTSHSPVH